MIQNFGVLQFAVAVAYVLPEGLHTGPTLPNAPSTCCRVGFNENLVRKGLLFLQTTGDLEYRRERRLVHRMK